MCLLLCVAHCSHCPRQCNTQSGESLDRDDRGWRENPRDTRRGHEEAPWHARYAKPMTHFRPVCFLTRCFLNIALLPCAVYLQKVGTNDIVGYATLDGVDGPMDARRWAETRSAHCVAGDRPYINTYGYKFSQAVRFSELVESTAKGQAQTWAIAGPHAPASLDPRPPPEGAVGTGQDTHPVAGG